MFKGKNRDYKIIGICMSCIQEEYERNIAMSVSREAGKRGYKVMIFNTFNNMYLDTAFTRGESSIFKLANYDLIDALVVLPESIKDESVWKQIVSDAKAAQVPVLSIDMNIEGCASIVFKYAETFEKVVRHIVEEHGCRRVNFIAGIKDNPFSDERIDCYKKVLAENGIAFDESRLGYGDFWEDPTLEVMERFLADSNELPEAIICCNDSMAMAACKALRKHGYSVPQDVLVTGFDGIELEKYHSPRLTTASVDIDSMGIVAVDLIEKAMSGEEIPDVTGIPFKMRISQSCGCETISADYAGEKLKELYDMMSMSKYHEAHMFRYLYETVECHTLDDLANIICNYSDDYTWCCINTDFFTEEKQANRYHELFTENINNFSCSINRKAGQPQIFPTCNLLPDMEKAFESESYFMFVPIHFQSVIMGYAAVVFSTDNFNFTNTQRFIYNTNQILENLKNRIMLQGAYAEMAQMHIIDPLTGIFNRRGFYSKAQELFEKYGKGKRYIIVSADMDGLKQINDNCGHTMGDKAISAASSTLVKAAGADSICARFGGDEFVVLKAAEDFDKCSQDFSESVKTILEEYNSKSVGEPEVYLSCGFAELKEPAMELFEETLKIADGNMYAHKRKRKKILSGINIVKKLADRQ